MTWHRITRATGLVEHVCAHGVGHADHASADVIAARLGHEPWVWRSHGCDGCCARDDFPGRLPEGRQDG